MTSSAVSSIAPTLSNSPRHSDSGSSNDNNTSTTATKEVHIDPKRYKTKICRNYVTNGECPYETRCMFAHGPHEVRTPDENTRDGLVTESAIKRHQQQLMYLARTQTSNTPPPAVPLTTVAPPVPEAPCTCPDCVSLTAQTVMYSHNPYAVAPYSMEYAPLPYMRGGYCECPDCVGAAALPPAYEASPLPPPYYSVPSIDFDVYAP